MTEQYRFDGESDPIATNPILRGVDLAFERLVKRDCFTERTMQILDELRAEVVAAEAAHSKDLRVASSTPTECRDCGRTDGGCDRIMDTPTDDERDEWTATREVERQSNG